MSPTLSKEERATRGRVTVPLLDLKAQYRSIKREIDEAVQEVLESQIFIMGPEVQSLESEIAEFVGVDSAVGVSSGTDALLVSLMAYGIGPGDEVVTTPYSFFATAGVIARLGARPVFVDIDPSTFNMNPGHVADALSARTKAVMPVHLYGQCMKLDDVLAVADERNIPVIEDAAQAFGCYDAANQHAGTLGDVGCFSFFPSKNLGGAGDGGVVVTSDKALGEKIKMLRVHGSRPKYYHSVVGGNFRLDAIQAAVVRVKLRYLKDWTERRRMNAARYRKLFVDANLSVHIGLPNDTPGHGYNQFVVRVPRRDALREFLKGRSVGTEVYYPLPLHLQECFGPLGYGHGAFPEAERAASETMALPIYPELTDEQAEWVVQCFEDFYRSG